MTDVQEPKRAWTPGPWAAYNGNEGTDYFPSWEVANDAYHNPPADDDAPWIAVHLTTGVKADAYLIALAPELAEFVLTWSDSQDKQGDLALALHASLLGRRLADRLRRIGGEDD